MASQNRSMIEFYYDISCPFAYIASTKIEALAARTNANILWRPVLLGAIYRATSAPQGAAGSASDVFNSTKKAVTSRAFRRTIKRHGLPYNEPPKHPQKTTAALRLLYGVTDMNDRAKLTHQLYKAYWVDGKDITSKMVLSEAVRNAELRNSDALLISIENDTFDGEAQRKELEVSTDLAVQRGSPGVPAFWIPEELWTDRNGKKQKGRLYWGQDRMQFVEAVVLGLNNSIDGDNLSKITKPLRSLTPRCVHRGIPHGEEVKLEFWYDFSSPWAFLGWTRLDSLQRRFGSKLQIELKPFLLGILFREIGAPNLPMAAISKQKQAYSRLDHGDWVRWWNAINLQEGQADKNIDFYWADIFPIRTPTVLRAALVEPKLTGALYRACWERNLNMSSDDVLKTTISNAGFDSEAIMAKANSQHYKTELRNRTAEALKAGICGVPIYRVFRRREGTKEWKQTGNMVWGQDELAVVEDLIAGWDGSGIARVEGEGKEGRSKL